MAQPTVQRRSSPRGPVTVQCLLARRVGAPIACETLDVGGGGMRVRSGRPLSVDEAVEFTLSLAGGPLAGQARVLRMQGHNEYALRFEGLREEAAQVLRETLGL